LSEVRHFSCGFAVILTELAVRRAGSGAEWVLAALEQATDQDEPGSDSAGGCGESG
jgi:hypothetical protein